MHEFLWSNSALLPQLNYTTQFAFSSGYGILLISILLLALPHRTRFFVSERWGGYAASAPDVDFIQHPVVGAVLYALWVLCGVALTLHFYSVVFAFINVLFCRYFFIHMRWKGVLRGMGAPGFMTYWTGLAVLLLEFSTSFAPDCYSLCLLVLQIDFAFIMLSAGIYKFSAGYAKNHGMEYGMVNPEWGYWPSLYKRIPPSSIVFVLMNHLAWSTEIVAGLLMLVPQTRFIGGLIILLSFVFIATQIRLTLLCEVVILDCFLFFGHKSILEPLFSLFVSPGVTANGNIVDINPTVSLVFRALVLVYLFGLPLAHAGLFYNFYRRKSLPSILQMLLEKYTNFFGIIIWRVFSVDVVNFFVKVYRVEPLTGSKTLLSRYGWGGEPRFNHVGESITLTSLFTTLKYYASNQSLFNERILRYANTFGDHRRILFEYFSIVKNDRTFEYSLVAEYEVDSNKKEVIEKMYQDSSIVSSPHVESPVSEGVKPGSYVRLSK